MSENGSEQQSLETPPEQIAPAAFLRLGSLVLYTGDLQRTIAFYRLFGLTFVPDSMAQDRSIIQPCSEKRSWKFTQCPPTARLLRQGYV
jgi:hypothetical protein